MRRLNKEEADNITRIAGVVVSLAKEGTKVSAVLNQATWLRDYTEHVYDKEEEKEIKKKETA